jgi:MFS family permease
MAVPALGYTFLVLGIPESPRWLITGKNDIEGGKKILMQLGVANADAGADAIIESAKHETAGTQKTGLFNGKYNKVLWLAFLIAFFNQWSGINFILYYAPRILEQAGLASKESLGNSIAIGATNLVFTYVGLYLIDKLGRKTLLIIGSIGYIISLALVAYAFQSGAGSTFLLVFLMMFIASHAIGQGAVIWVFLSEIFPTRVRSLGSAFGASTHWVFAAIITLIAPVFIDDVRGIFRDNPWPIFAFFALMMVLQLLWVLLKVPETKGVSLEDLEKKFVKT